MKTLFLFFLALFFGLIIAIGLQITKYTIAHKAVHKLPQTHFSIADPPSASLKGNLLSFTGTVDWQSRIATQPAQLTALRQIQQGETLETKTDGAATAQFPKAGFISLAPSTQIDFAQTLPDTIVFVQDSGEATYTATKSNTPLSIRSLDLLTRIENGTSTITIAGDDNTITVQVQSGQAIEAYDDTNYVSHVVTISEGQQFIFDGGAKDYTME